VGGRQISRGFEPNGNTRQATSEQAVGFGENVQPLFRSDPREVAHAERQRRRRVASFVAGQIDPERHDRHLFRSDLEQARHRWHVIVADRDEPIDIGHLPPDQLDGSGAIRLDEAVEKQIFALQGAGDRPFQRVSQRPRQADEERVRQIHDVGNRFVGNPLEQLVEFFPQHAAIALQHRHRQIAEEPGVGGQRPARERADDGRRVQKAIDESRRTPEERKALLKIDADAAEEHAIAARIRFVRIGRRVERQECHLVAARQQLDGQCVVARAAAAIHAGRACRDRKDLHMSAV
jgi:hypothetical protein